MIKKSIVIFPTLNLFTCVLGVVTTCSRLIIHNDFFDVPILATQGEESIAIQVLCMLYIEAVIPENT